MQFDLFLYILLYGWLLSGLYAVKYMSGKGKNPGKYAGTLFFCAPFFGPVVLVTVLYMEGKLSFLDVLKKLFTETSAQEEEEFSLTILDRNGKDLFSGSEASSSEAAVYLRKMICKAVEYSCSDIFIDPKESVYVIRFRVDGAIRVYDTQNEEEASSLISLIKVASGMDIAEKRRPQDGSFSSEKPDGASVSFRVASVGVFGGEKITIRLIGSENSKRALTETGLSGRQLQIVRNGIKLPSGMVLMCGPTGSGKTSTLYSMLGEIDYNMKNVISIEDPIERVIPSISQMEVNARAGITFATLLRNSLRQNPDILCVGEIRDEETAQVAAHAAQTGHLIIATLHSNDNIGTIMRLMDLGIPLRAVAACLHLSISQRLVRRLCPKCKRKVAMTPEQKEFCNRYGIAETALYAPAGCPACDSTGYSGRRAVFELLVMDKGLRAAMEDANATITSIQEYLNSNPADSSLAARTMQLVLDGETSWDEFERVNINI